MHNHENVSQANAVDLGNSLNVLNSFPYGHQHNFPSHLHSLSFCYVCDVAYCTSCGAEFGRSYQRSWTFTTPGLTAYAAQDVQTAEFRNPDFPQPNKVY